MRKAPFAHRSGAASCNYCKKDQIDLININDKTINENFNNTFLIFEGI